MPATERAAIRDQLSPGFVIARPEPQSAPFVFCSPHSGRDYPAHFLRQSRLDPHTLRRSEDCFVDELFSGAVEHGAPLISARFPRAFLDVNREPYELDPHLFREPLPDFANSISTRVLGGLGTIARIVADGEEIYRDRLSLEAGLVRIEELYKPFHAALDNLVRETHHRFGTAILIDCHSMPSLALTPLGPARPDIVLGDRFGTSCDSRITAYLKDLFLRRGYDVHINRPYAGGYITEHYGRPLRGVHTLQIEINRGLYLNEAKLVPASGFAGLRQDLADIVGLMLRDLPELLRGRAAAE